MKTLIDNEEYRGYKAHMMNGVIEWWRTTRTKSVSEGMTTGKEVRSGSHIARVVTAATTIEEARKQLDRRLAKPKKEKEVNDPGQMSLLQ